MYVYQAKIPNIKYVHVLKCLLDKKRDLNMSLRALGICDGYYSRIA